MMRDFIDFAIEILVPVGIAAMLTAVFSAGVIGCGAKMAAQAFPERLETQRRAVERLGCSASEDVIGTAVDFNRDIASARWWNQTVFAMWYPNEIADATPIEIPECR